MDEKTRSRYEAKSAELRADLKKWEGDWASAHDGRKPGREDIKRNPEIAKKYKDYNKCRDILSGKVPPPTKPSKRKNENAPAQTPQKRTRYTETPVKNRGQQEEGLMGTPAISRKLFSPTPVTALGPTPQRDGRVLGLFDLLIEKELGTPKKGTEKEAGGNKVMSTPSKRQSTADPDSGRLGRTPMSSSKRQLLNTFMTPLKNKDGSRFGDDGGTPSSVSKLQFDTPAFLKRHSFPMSAAAEAEVEKPAPLRLPRKPLVRGLSEIVASLRKIEEEYAEADEDDLEALREMEEMEGGGGAGPMVAPKMPVPAAQKLLDEEVLAPDRPARALPLGGFDDEADWDSPTEDQVGRDGMPLKVYKKKGQKRTTRRSNMKPVRSVRRAASVDLGGKSDGEDEEELGTDEEAEVFGSDAESEYDEGEMKKKDKKKEEEEEKKKKSKQSGEGTAKKTARKVNPLAHANFQRLKLRQGGAKGGPGFNSRFRRRR